MASDDFFTVAFLIGLAVAFVFGCVGKAVGSRKNAGIEGFWWGFLLGPFGVLIVAVAIDNRDPCPICHGRLDGKPKVCPHCASEIPWAAIEAEQRENERREREEKERWERVNREAEQKQWEQSQRAREQLRGQWAARIRSIGHALIGIPQIIDAVLVRIIGKENTILVRFVRILAIALVCIGGLSSVVVLLTTGGRGRQGIAATTISVPTTKAKPERTAKRQAELDRAKPAPLKEELESSNRMETRSGRLASRGTAIDPNLGPERAEKPLSYWKAQAKSNSIESRMAAATALAKTGSAGIPALVELLRDKEEGVRNAAGVALSKVGLPAIPALIEMLRDNEKGVQVAAGATLAMMGPPAIPALIDLLRDKEESVRKAAIKVLVAIGPPAIPALIGSLQDKDTRVREAAATALGNIGQPAIPALLELVRDGQENVRQAAGWALGLVGSPAIPDLVKLFRAKERSVRRVACEGLSNMGSPAIPTLVELLRDEDPIVRRNAATILGSFGAEAKIASNALWELLRDKEAAVRWAAAEAIERLDLPAESVTDKRKAINAVVEESRDWIEKHRVKHTPTWKRNDEYKTRIEQNERKARELLDQRSIVAALELWEQDDSLLQEITASEEKYNQLINNISTQSGHDRTLDKLHKVGAGDYERTIRKAREGLL